MREEFFSAVRESASNMTEVVAGIGKHWSDFCHNAWLNSPNQQGDYDATRAGIITGPGWDGDIEGIRVNYDMIDKFDYPDSAGPGWLCETSFVISHMDLDCLCRRYSRKTDNQSYWFDADAYFANTGIEVITWRRRCDNWYEGSEVIDLRFILLQKDWPKLTSSWDQMRVAKRLMPEQASELPDFVE